MSFQSSAQSIRSKLHLHRYRPSVLAVFLVFAIAVILATVICAVQLVKEHAVSVVSPDSASALIQDNNSFVDRDGQARQDPAVDAPEAMMVVYVSGAVLSPGLYEVEEGCRIGTAIDLAGGALEEAALESVNLARIVSDGEQIHVPSQEELKAGFGSAANANGPVANGALPMLININTASLDQLMSLDGVGQATANKIIADREANGPFAAKEDLMRVSGIGQKKFDAIKDHICV